MRMVVARLAASVLLSLHASQVWAQAKPPGKEYTSESVRMWIPDDVKVIRGVWWIVARASTLEAYLDNLNPNDPRKPAGVTSAGNRAFAKSQGLAMAYDRNDRGGGTDILARLRSFAQLSGHPELAHAGLIGMGISGGGGWTVRTLRDMPERMITCFPSHWSVEISDVEAARRVPRLDMVVANDGHAAEFPGVDNIPFVLRGREKGAIWSAFVNTNGNHGYWGYHELKMMQLWMKHVLPMRLPAEIPLDRVPEWKSIPIEDHHWLGTIEYTKWPIRISKLTISPVSKFVGDKGKALWFPSQEFAREWMKNMGFDPPDPILESPVCGNGRLDPGEACDDGPRNDDTAAGACNRTCGGLNPAPPPDAGTGGGVDAAPAMTSRDAEVAMALIDADRGPPAGPKDAAGRGAPMETSPEDDPAEDPVAKSGKAGGCSMGGGALASPVLTWVFAALLGCTRRRTKRHPVRCVGSRCRGRALP